jgi:hypothetical protein
VSRQQFSTHQVIGGYVAADAAGWLPGWYPTRRAALKAAKGHGRPKQKDRAFARREGPVVSWGGGMNCTCGRVIRWGHLRRAEYDRLLEDLAAHDYCDDDA